jgi:phospholipase C
MPSTNVMTITDNSATITSMSYVSGSVVVTSGQKNTPPPTVQKSGKVFTISFDCDRKNSSSVADSFNTASGGSAHEYAAYGGGGTPDELNFWFSLQIEFSTPQGSGTAILNVGQGHSGSHNNWWLGGSIVNSSKPNLTIAIDNTAFKLSLPVSGDVSEYTFSAGSISNAWPIRNVFVLMLENHSFDNMFAMSGIAGITAATTADSNSYNGVTYPVLKGAPTSMPTDPGHEFTDVVTQLAGMGASYPSGGPYPAIDNSGFAANYATTSSEGDPPPASDIGLIMAAFDTPNQLPVIYQLATDFVLCDHWFSSLPGPTWPNRFFVHGASSNGLDHSPSTGEMTEWETVSGFTYPNGSIFQAMANDNISYRLYNDNHNIFSDDPQNGSIGGAIAQVSSLKGIQMFDVHSINDFANDLQNGYTAQYTFIEPNYGDVVSGSYAGGSSQHPMDDVYGGESMIKYVYESIRNSPLWNESLLIITYDEHGGFYDSVAPGSTTPPNDGSSNSSLNQYGFTFDTLGVRVPALVISPWIGTGVDHTVYDHSSVLATVEKLLGLAPLTQRDGSANDLTHLLQASARTNCPTTLNNPAPPTASAAKRVAAGRARFDPDAPIPDRGMLAGLLGIALKTEIELAGGTDAARSALIARFRLIRTLGQADAYLKSVMGRVESARAARRT